jgi:hypothetical protein
VRYRRERHACHGRYIFDRRHNLLLSCLLFPPATPPGDPPDVFIEDRPNP